MILKQKTVFFLNVDKPYGKIHGKICDGSFRGAVSADGRAMSKNVSSLLCSNHMPPWRTPAEGELPYMQRTGWATNWYLRVGPLTSLPVIWRKRMTTFKCIDVLSFYLGAFMHYFILKPQCSYFHLMDNSRSLYVGWISWSPQIIMPKYMDGVHSQLPSSHNTLTSRI